MEGAFPAEGFMINYVPNKLFIDSVVNNAKYMKYFKSQRDSSCNFDVIYHSTDTFDVFADERYLNFMNELGDSAIHVIDCREINEEVISRYRAVNLAQKYRAM